MHELKKKFNYTTLAMRQYIYMQTKQIAKPSPFTSLLTKYNLENIH